MYRFVSNKVYFLLFFKVKSRMSLLTCLRGTVQVLCKFSSIAIATCQVSVTSCGLLLNWNQDLLWLVRSEFEITQWCSNCWLQLLIWEYHVHAIFNCWHHLLRVDCGIILSSASTCALTRVGIWTGCWYSFSSHIVRTEHILVCNIPLSIKNTVGLSFQSWKVGGILGLLTSVPDVFFDNNAEI